MKHIYNEQFVTGLLNECTFTRKAYPVLSKTLHPQLTVRPLGSDDFKKGFMDILTSPELDSLSNDIKERRFQKFYSVINSSPGIYYPLVIEDKETSRLIASGMLIVEQKFIHACAVRGRIESVNVNADNRRKGVGSLLLESLSRLSKHLGCYKTTLNCSQEYVAMCRNIGFVDEKSQNFMLKHYNKNNNDGNITNNRTTPRRGKKDRLLHSRL